MKRVRGALKWRWEHMLALPLGPPVEILMRPPACDGFAEMEGRTTCGRSRPSVELHMGPRSVRWIRRNRG
eukprot:3767895-Pyramimonas_sp.AAC.1